MSEKAPPDESYRYTHTFSSKSTSRKHLEELDNSPIVSDALDVLLRTSKVGRAFAESSLSIRNAMKGYTDRDAEEKE